MTCLVGRTSSMVVGPVSVDGFVILEVRADEVKVGDELLTALLPPRWERVLSLTAGVNSENISVVSAELGRWHHNTRPDDHVFVRRSVPAETPEGFVRITIDLLNNPEPFPAFGRGEIARLLVALGVDLAAVSSGEERDDG